MATTFQTAFEQLMDMVGRPLTETAVLSNAKKEINNAIRFLQRNHAFVYTETLAEISYTANAQSIDSTAFTAGILRNVLSVQQLSATGNYEGKPLRVKSYAQLQSDRMHYLGRYPAGISAEYDEAANFANVYSIEEAYRSDKIAFVVGQRFGLYPRQIDAVPLMLHFSIWLPTLEGINDTNFFLDYALDVVLMLALRRMHIYLKVDDRFSVTKEEVAENIQTLITWDSQIRETPMTTIA
jgi:hypothetical protein